MSGIVYRAFPPAVANAAIDRVASLVHKRLELRSFSAMFVPTLSPGPIEKVDIA